MPALLTPSAVAMRWSVSVRHIQRMAERREIRALRIAGQWRFRLEDVEAAEAVLTQESTAPTPITGTAPAESADWTYEPVVAGVVPWRESIPAPESRRSRGTNRRRSAAN